MSDQKIRETLVLHPMQDDFIYGDWKYGAYFGEFANGKTTSAILRAQRLSKVNKNVGMVLRKVWSDNRDTTLRQFHEKFPELEPYYKSSEHIHEFPNGSIIFWRGMDRIGRVQQLNNYVLGWFWIEQMEENFEEVWNILEGRLRLPGVPLSGWGTANPAGHNWCWNKFISTAKDPAYRYFQPPPRWNAKNLPKDYYEEKEKSWPQQLIDRYLNGKHEGYEGLVYSIFTESGYVKEREIPKHGGEWWEGQDYGVSDTSPMVWLFVYRDVDGHIHIVDEFYQYKCLPETAALAVKAKRGLLGYGERYVLTTGCPRTFQKEKDGRTPAELFASQYGITIIQAPVTFDIRYPIVYELFKTERLSISPNCRNLIRELNRYSWDRLNTADDHAIEALERVIYKMMQTEQRRGWNWADEKKLERPITAGILSRQF